jgi:hypothetical protein
MGAHYAGAKALRTFAHLGKGGFQTKTTPSIVETSTRHQPQHTTQSWPPDCRLVSRLQMVSGQANLTKKTADRAMVVKTQRGKLPMRLPSTGWWF